MTFTETAAAFRRLADGIDKVIQQQGKDCETGKPKAVLDEASAIGAAMMLIYLRDLVTVANRESWDKGAILVMLETVSRDAEFFPCGVAQVMWQAEEEPGDAL